MSNAQLNSAIDGTSSNTNAVSLLNTSGFSDPPTLADLMAVANKQNEIITALRR